MKSNFQISGILFFIVGLFLFSSCNTAADQLSEESSSLKVRESTVAQKAASYEEYSKMTIEEKWNSLSAERRNYLRENPDLYPNFKPLIAANPEMEEVTHIVNHPQGQDPSATSNVNVTDHSTGQQSPKEWWDSFSEKRKNYMREHPDQYPEFAPYF